MKTVILVFAVLVSITAQARIGGSEGTGGGDLCEDRIKIIRDDLKSWITRNGSIELKLPQGISSSRYSTEMLKALTDAKVQCVGSGDRGYPVLVDNVPKVCRFDTSEDQKLITCDYAKFTSMIESYQYVLIHHEYAGIAGIENPSKADSNYEVSNQITGYLIDEVVKRLAVKPIALPANEPVEMQPGSKVVFKQNLTLPVGESYFRLAHGQLIPDGQYDNEFCNFYSVHPAQPWQQIVIPAGTQLTLSYVEGPSIGGSQTYEAALKGTKLTLKGNCWPKAYGGGLNFSFYSVSRAFGAYATVTTPPIEKIP
jgi:hypothetical protein